MGTIGFREHRGSLSDSLKTHVEIEPTMEALVAHLQKVFPEGEIHNGPITADMIKITYYSGHDTAWGHIWIVEFNAKNGVLGFLSDNIIKNDTCEICSRMDGLHSEEYLHHYCPNDPRTEVVIFQNENETDTIGTLVGYNGKGKWIRKEGGEYSKCYGGTAGDFCNRDSEEIKKILSDRTIPKEMVVDLLVKLQEHIEVDLH